MSETQDHNPPGTRQVACPHCGFKNFSISAYCGRCERPLREITPQPRERPQTPPPTSGPPLVRPPLAAVPPPSPPELPSLEPAPLPIQLPEQHKPKSALQSSRRGKASTAPQPQQDFRMTLPGLPRIWFAYALDAALILGVATGVGVLETLLGDSGAEGRFMLDRLANWLATYPDIALRATVVGASFAVGYTAWCQRQGPTLGRLITRMALVHRHGRPFSWPMGILRGVLALVGAVALGAGFFVTLVDPRHRPLHDIIMGTMTVGRRPR